LYYFWGFSSVICVSFHENLGSGSAGADTLELPLFAQKQLREFLLLLTSFLFLVFSPFVAALLLLASRCC
jgi:hypothetical protein